MNRIRFYGTLSACTRRGQAPRSTAKSSRTRMRDRDAIARRTTRACGTSPAFWQCILGQRQGVSDESRDSTRSCSALLCRGGGVQQRGQQARRIPRSAATCRSRPSSAAALDSSGADGASGTGARRARRRRTRRRSTSTSLDASRTHRQRGSSGRDVSGSGSVATSTSTSSGGTVRSTRSVTRRSARRPAR